MTMLARIAQELFWLGRDLSRAELTARMLDGVFHADLQGRADAISVTLSWEALLLVIGAQPAESSAARASADDGERALEKATTRATRDDVVRLLTVDAASPASIVSCVARGRERARTVRDVISTEMWEAVNTFHLELVRRDLSAAMRTGPYSIYSEVKERCALFWGLTDRTMMRDEARSFLVAGGRIESADMVLRMLRASLPLSTGASVREMLDDGEALALLHAVGGLQAYRRAVRAAPRTASVTRFLLYDRSYPGSVAASVDGLHYALSTADTSPRSAPPVLRLGRMVADLDFRRRATVDDAALGSTLVQVQEELAAVDRDVANRYFAGAAPRAVRSPA